MKQDLRDAWVAGLRSGRYRQGFLYLERGCALPGTEAGSPLHCCIGVLAREAIALGYDIPVGGQPNRPDITTFGGRYAALNPDVLDLVGLPYSAQDYLNVVNDGTGASRRRWSFGQIADWIEENVPVEA